MRYVHQYFQQETLNLPFGKAVCVGRNYAEHAKELHNPIPKNPLLFIKPASCASFFMPAFTIPTNRGCVHYEAEIAVLIGEDLSGVISKQQAHNAIVALGCALDLTLRDEQSVLKQQGLPWELAKSFDGALVLTPFTCAHNLDLANLGIKLTINGNLKQDGNSSQMLWPILELIQNITSYFKLEAGDVILTGTPSGVGVLNIGDKVQLELTDLMAFEAVVN